MDGEKRPGKVNPSRPPLIQELASYDFNQNPAEEEVKSEKAVAPEVKAGQKRRF